MRARLFLLFILFLLYSATSYIGSTSFIKLKGEPFWWRDDNIHMAGIILTLMQFFSIFLGGILAAFIIPVWVLLALLFSSLIIAISIFEVAALGGNVTMADKENFTSQNYVVYVVSFFVLFGIYSGMSKFILLVMILNQETTSIEFAMASYLFSLNLSTLLVYILLPSSINIKYYVYIALPLILIAIILLLIGRLKKIYILEKKKINIIGIIHKRFLSTIDRNSILNIKTEIHNIATESTEILSSKSLTNSFENSTEAILSFSRLSIIFITLLPYGICESQLRTTFIIQSNYLAQHIKDYYSMKSGFWVLIINCSGVLIFIPLLALLKNYNIFFENIFRQFMPRIIASYLLMFLSIISAGIVETIRLDIYWGSIFSTVPSPYTINQVIDNTTYSAADMSIFFMTPQLLFSSISEILLITTCGQFLYEQSVGSIKFLAISFFLGAVGSGGAGDLISFGLTMILNKKMFDPLDLNKRTLTNGTCCSFQSRLDTWFYCLAGVFFLTIILITILISNFKLYYQKKYTSETFVNNDIFQNNL